MSSQFVQYLTFPVGRLVWGSVSKGRDKDRAGKPLTTREGKPRTDYTFGVAIEKAGTTHWNQTPWGKTIWDVANAGMPQLTGRPQFAWKIVDGDSTTPNENGTVPATQEGFPGCWVLRFKSSFPPSTYNADGSAPVPADAIKCGHYVQVAGSVDINGDTSKPGVYLNPSMVAHSGYGPEIKAGPDPSAAGFGQGPRPAGMQTAPVGGLPASAPPPLPGPNFHGSTGNVLAGGAAMAAAGTALPPPAAPTAVAPAPSFIQPPPAAAAPPPPPPAVPAGPTVTAKANGATWAQLQAAGWTEAVARQHGMIV